MSKRVVIVTWFESDNFGTVLQAYSLYHKIANLGYSVFFLRKIGIVRSIKQIFNKLFPFGNINSGALETKANKLESNYSIIDFYTIHPLHCKINRTTDVYVTGSDQIWNTMFFWDPFYYLYFAKHNKKIAYGSSIGTSQINPRYRQKVKKYLSRFVHIGVREHSSVEMLSSLLGRNDIVSVPDPTFLLSKEDWENFAQNAVFDYPVPRRYMFVYFIGNSNAEVYNQMIKTIRKEYDIRQIIVIPSYESGVSIDTAAGDWIDKEAGPYEFVSLLQNATIVCTDSFHATALAINLGKEFYVAKRFADHDPQSQNTRIQDLLSHYGLSRRLYNGKCDTDTIDTEYISNIIKNDRKYGIQYLTDSIEQ